MLECPCLFVSRCCHILSYSWHLNCFKSVNLHKLLKYTIVFGYTFKLIVIICVFNICDNVMQHIFKKKRKSCSSVNGDNVNLDSRSMLVVSGRGVTRILGRGVFQRGRGGGIISMKCMCYM